MIRGIGILMPIFSLPNKSGFGTLGKEAYEFVDFLVSCNQKYWQVLPINDVDIYNSPFCSTCIYSGNPLFIDLEEFYSKKELLDYGFNKKMDFETYKKVKMELLYVWFSRSDCKGEIENFKKENSWVNEYAKFMALRLKFKELKNFTSEYKNVNSNKYLSYLEKNREMIEFFEFTQYIFFKQWFKLKEYVNSKGILIIGDSPCNSSMDSVEAFYHRDMYLLDQNLNPTKVAGVPPDYFSKEGQCWNTLIYNYPLIKENNYEYLLNKYRYMLKIYDYLKVDHFRALEYYYEIPYGRVDGKVGEWRPGPGYEFIDLLKNNNLTNLILEDLGIISEGVIRLKDYSGFPGMKVFEFAFGEENSPFLPHNYSENCVVYTGTHDNDTFASMLKDKEYRKKVKDYLKIESDDNKDIIYSSIKALAESKGSVLIVTPQDLLLQGNKYRFNTPGTLTNNWSYNASRELYDEEIKQFLKELTIKTRRCN